jgi:hypothetical protein
MRVHRQVITPLSKKKATGFSSVTECETAAAKLVLEYQPKLESALRTDGEGVKDHSGDQHADPIYAPKPKTPYPPLPGSPPVS